jgi:hypothetical protein
MFVSLTTRRRLIEAILTATLSLQLLGFNVKVVSVDYKTNDVTLLLPMHNTKVEARLVVEEKETRVRVNEFYEAEIESGQVDTTKRNLLRIKIPHQKPATFQFLRIIFLAH